MSCCLGKQDFTLFVVKITEKKEQPVTGVLKNNCLKKFIKDQRCFPANFSEFLKIIFQSTPPGDCL